MKITKDEYILRNFSKIKHKKWELYVVTRIIHLLNDSEIEFVCQQLIKTPENKKYYTDLCFPQLKLYCEIDEMQHSKISHSIADEDRMREIIDASEFKEKRIKIFDENLNIKKLEDINYEIDSLVKFIIDRKRKFVSSNNFYKWDYYNKYNPENFIKRGYLDVQDNIGFLYIKDALKCFGYKGGHYQKAIWKIKGTKKSLWFPKLYENKDWNNSLSMDLKKIEMKKRDDSIIGDVGEYQWIVFAHNKDFLGQIIYKFLGEFHSSKESSTKTCHVLFRKKTMININEYL